MELDRERGQGNIGKSTATLASKTKFSRQAQSRQVAPSRRSSQFFILHSAFLIALKTSPNPSMISHLRRGARESAAAQEFCDAISSLVSMY